VHNYFALLANNGNQNKWKLQLKTNHKLTRITFECRSLRANVTTTDFDWTFQSIFIMFFINFYQKNHLVKSFTFSIFKSLDNTSLLSRNGNFETQSFFFFRRLKQKKWISFLSLITDMRRNFADFSGNRDYFFQFTYHYQSVLNMTSEVRKKQFMNQGIPSFSFLLLNFI